MSIPRLSENQGIVYLLDHAIEPAMTVRLGERFAVRSTDPDLPARLGYAQRRTPPELNPVSGPIYIEGVERGDTLVVGIESIEVADHGWSGWSEHAGGILGPSTRWPELDEPLSQVIQHAPGKSGTTRDGRGIVAEPAQGLGTLEWELAPFIGTLATAPDREVEASLVAQGPFGGNLDCRDVRPGVKVRLPAYHEGGLLFCGDVHAMQGDMEFYGSADESQGEMTLVCEVLKGQTVANPRIEKPESIVAVCCSRPVEEAARQATFDLMDWMITEYDLDPREAYFHVGVNPDFRINVYQMVPWGRLSYTVGAEIPKKYLR